MTLPRLDLARGTLDRAAHLRRQDPAALLAAPDLVVLQLQGDRLAVTSGETPALRPADPAELLKALDARREAAAADASGSAGPVLVFLGHVAGSPRAAWLLPGGVDDVPPAPSADDVVWATLREIGSLLGDEEAGLATAALALAQWHATHRFCSKCAGALVADGLGWTRRCTVCGTEHFPRTDPAVIMSVVDADDRLLLGRQAAWAPGRYSTLAGFVEAGESAEAAVRRETFEEAGVHVGDVHYLGSQPWPFPRSLMLAFTGRATSTTIDVDGDELSSARWVTRDELRAECLSGELTLPPSISVAHRLIEHWFGEPLPAAQTAWR